MARYRWIGSHSQEFAGKMIAPGGYVDDIDESDLYNAELLENGLLIEVTPLDEVVVNEITPAGATEAVNENE